MQLIKQDNLIQQIDSSSFKTFPHSLMLVGEYGSGKHSLVKYIAEKFNMEIVDMNEHINLEFITEINQKTSPYIYVINGNEISVKEESVLLKFLEEPLKNAFIIILCENKHLMLNTIINRCQVWELNKYNADDLLSFYDTDSNDCNHSEKQKQLLFKLVNTPGKMIKWNNQPALEIYDLCNKIFEKVKIANFPNVLTIANKVDFEMNSLDKYDDKFFTEMLLYCSKQRVIENSDKERVVQYKLTQEFHNSLNIPHINKKQLFEHYLYELRVN